MKLSMKTCFNLLLFSALLNGVLMFLIFFQYIMAAFVLSCINFIIFGICIHFMMDNHIIKDLINA